jgi:transcriptional regulator of acetoin/glycerol metabolism
MADDRQVTAKDMDLEPHSPASAGAATPSARRGPLIDERRLREAMDRHDHNVTRVARALGVSRMTVYRSLRRYGRS